MGQGDRVEFNIFSILMRELVENTLNLSVNQKKNFRQELEFSFV